MPKPGPEPTTRYSAQFKAIAVRLSSSVRRNLNPLERSEFVNIRRAREKDVGELWALMKELAIFERYIDSFAITPEAVRESGFRKDPPDFHSFVAEERDHLVGMIVYYFIPYTAENCPALYIKELYVAENYRGHGVGRDLMHVLRDEARAKNCKTIKWTVAPWNEGGIEFYEKLGATENTEWLNFEWSV